jgi:phosphoribosylanthranilate isomerase
LVWIKICGLTREEDARTAIDCGADAIGVVVDAPSPRSVDAGRARAILGLGGDVDRVAVTTSESVEDLVEMTRAALPTMLQLHGPGDRAFLEVLREELDAGGLGDTGIVKAVGIGSDADRDALINSCRDYCRTADALLLDTRVRGASGGTGVAHDWGISRWLVERLVGTRVILAGGLSPKNVAAGITTVGPHGVDASSGVERAPGRKDPDKIRSFISAARKASP